MPDILKPYSLQVKDKKRLVSKFGVSGADHNNWSDEDILDIRSKIRNYYRTEQKGKCAYCKQPLSLVSASNCQIEHIMSKAKYIEFIYEPKNLCVICADCNEIKRGQEVLNDIPEVTKKINIISYPRVSNSFKIFHPHYDCFDDHILEINGFYIDKTKKGGYTIQICNLNRKLHKIGYENASFSDIEIRELMTKYLNTSDTIQSGETLKKIRNLLILI